MKITLNLALVAVLVLLTGCGSLASRWRGQRGEAYPGVRMDVEHATHYTTEGEWIALFDIPLSAIVDTLFLPYDLSKPSPAKDQPQQSADAAEH
jgi:uncharacterized protein YceK